MGHVARTEERRGAYRVLGGLFGRSTRRWGDNIKMGVQEMRWEGMDWIDLAQDRELGGGCEWGNEPSGFIKCREFLD